MSLSGGEKRWEKDGTRIKKLIKRILVLLSEELIPALSAVQTVCVASCGSLWRP